MWRSLIQMAKSQPQYDWKLLLQSCNFDLFKYRFLNPKEGEASRVICPKAKKCDVINCSCRDVRIIGGHLVAYCREKYSEPRLPLSGHDIMYVGLNFAKFHHALCAAFGLEFMDHDLDRQMFWEIGTLRRGPGNRVSVYLSYYTTRAPLRARLQQMLAEKKQPFIVIAADKMVFPQEMITELDKQGCTPVFLHESVTLNADSSFTVASEILEWLGQIKQTKKQPSGSVYRTPPGTKWIDIHIKPKDDSSISIWMRTDQQPTTITSSQLGLHNTKKNCPNKAFIKLKEFLNAPNKSIQCSHRGSKEQNDLRHRVREINDAFKTFFPDIGTPVIELLKTGKCFMLNVTAVPDPDC